MSKCLNCREAGKHAFCNLGAESHAYFEANSLNMEYPRGSTPQLQCSSFAPAR